MNDDLKAAALFTLAFVVLCLGTYALASRNDTCPDPVELAPQRGRVEYSL